MKILSLGQSGFIITAGDGTTVMTDPWLAPSPLKNFKTPIDYKKVQRCDAVLVSHNHLDHVDSCTLRMAKRLGAEFIGSGRAARRARRAGIEKVTALRPGDTAVVESLKIHAVPARHPLAADAVGFVIEGDATVYFSGDTRLDTHLLGELKKFKIDIALLQIACAVYFFKKDGLDVEDAAKLAEEIQPGVAVPMHYHDIFRHPDPEVFREKLSGAGIRVDILQPGEEREY
ncbi:MAG: MBL fold metallo-hydrolase [bacterium]